MKLISHKIFLKHDLVAHPENSDRIRKALKLFAYEEAPDGEEYLNRVHTTRYVARVKEASKLAVDKDVYMDAGETYVTKDTYKAACHAVGAAIAAADCALKKQPAMALVRPPGHHAHPDWTNGFCIFNSMAIAAKYLEENKQKVLIVDIDMHRGDGTQEVVQNMNEDGKLYYFSINQYGVFPGMTIDEGSITNVYVESGTSEDEYLEVLEKNLPPLINRFKPTVIAISAGFDSFATDKLTHAEQIGCGLSLTKKTITALKKIIQGIPYFVVLEGGYNPESVVDGVSAFTGVTVAEKKKKPLNAPRPRAVVQPTKKKPATKKKAPAKKKKTVKKKVVKKKAKAKKK